MSIYPYGTGNLLATSWQQQLRDAETESELVQVVRDFLATFSPYDLARLPENLRPGRIVDASDVADYAFTLARHNHDDSAGSARCIHRLANFFSSASLRLTQLMAGRGAAAGDMRMPPAHPEGHRPGLS